MKFDRRSGAWYRPGDKFVIDEVHRVYGQLPVGPGDVLLDLGANIGATSLLALRKGAAHVVAVDADPGNIPMLRRNLPKKQSTILWAAVGDRAGRTTFYVNPSRPFQSSKLRSAGARRLEVSVVPLAGLLAQYRPAVVKCDIEFGEYDLPGLHALPDTVRGLAMEVHVRHQRFTQSAAEIGAQRRAAADLLASIHAQGFREVTRTEHMMTSTAAPIDDDTGLPPLLKAIDAIWVRP